MDCSLPGFSLHGISQARILSGEPFPSPGDLPDPGIESGSPALQAENGHPLFIYVNFLTVHVLSYFSPISL